MIPQSEWVENLWASLNDLIKQNPVFITPLYRKCHIWMRNMGEVCEIVSCCLKQQSECDAMSYKGHQDHVQYSYRFSWYTTTISMLRLHTPPFPIHQCSGIWNLTGSVFQTYLYFPDIFYDIIYHYIIVEENFLSLSMQHKHQNGRSDMFQEVSLISVLSPKI